MSIISKMRMMGNTTPWTMIKCRLKRRGHGKIIYKIGTFATDLGSDALHCILKTVHLRPHYSGSKNAVHHLMRHWIYESDLESVTEAITTPKWEAIRVEPESERVSLLS